MTGGLYSRIDRGCLDDEVPGCCYLNQILRGAQDDTTGIVVPRYSLLATRNSQLIVVFVKQVLEIINDFGHWPRLHDVLGHKLTSLV